MNASITELIESALAQRRLWDGRVVRALERDDELDKATYFVSGIAPDFLERFESDPEATDITSDAIGIGPRLTFWVVGYQTGEFQQRFFLPLVGPTVANVIADVQQSDLRLFMDGGPSVVALQARVPVSAQLRATLANLHQAVVDRDSVLRDVVLTTARLLEPDGLRPANPLCRPAHVSVTAVLPPELLGDAGGLFGA